MTLIELLVVLMIIATCTTVSALTFAARAPAPRDALATCAARRRAALTTGRAMLFTHDTSRTGVCGPALVLPDGRVLTPNPRWDPITGALHDAP
jgi:hypothetical protein